MKAPRRFLLEWAFEPFQDHPTFFTKRMFGGLAAYFMDRLVMVLTESPGDRTYRGKVYPHEIWNGILFPTERAYQDTLREEFPALVPHPVLGKWLYLPLEGEDFEQTVMELGKLVSGNDPRLGVVSKQTRSRGTGH